MYRHCFRSKGIRPNKTTYYEVNISGTYNKFKPIIDFCGACYKSITLTTQEASYN